MRLKPVLKKACIFMLISSIILLNGCGTREIYKPTAFEQDDEWIKMVLEYRKTAAQNPDNLEIKASVKRAELDAAEHFYREGLQCKSEGKIDEAIAAMQKGLAVMEGNEKIINALAMLMAIKEADTTYRDAIVQKQAGNLDDAQKLLEKAVQLDPDNAQYLSELDSISSELKKPTDMIFASQKKISIKFSNTSLKSALDFIGSSYGINFIFDEGLNNVQVSASAEDVTLEQALDIVVSAGGVFYKKVGQGTLLIAQDTKAKRDQYEDLIIKTYQLNSIKAADMATILKSTLNLKRITVNENFNTISIRDTEDILKLADKIIKVNDRKPAEVIFDVEIIEVNRTKAEQLGLNYGGQMSLTPPTAGTTTSTINPGLTNMALSDVINQYTLTLPAFTLDFFKQDVDAKTLANPRIRVIEGKKAKIHIGDKVPLKSSEIQDATGQIRNTYDYKDIGVLLEVTPKINLDNTINVVLSLEVSSLGSNIGTTADPAYSIGTRDAETTMLLKDGETAILGGLIRNDENGNKIKLPILGDIPIIGGLFITSSDDSMDSTDVLLTITPRIVRSWEYISKDLKEIYSGTENNMSSSPKYFATVENVTGKKNKNNENIPENAPENSTGTAATAPAAETSTAQPGATIISFSDPQYILEAGQDGVIKIEVENLTNVTDLPLKLAFNPGFISFVEADNSAPDVVTNLSVNNSQAINGMVEMDFTLNPDKESSGKIEIASAKFTGIKQGVSYLLFLEDKILSKDGSTVNAQKTASRIVIK